MCRYTGIKKMDVFAPLGRGQRCALLGEPGSGKTTTAINALIHHAKSDPDAHCVYAAVGTVHPPEPVVALLEKEGVLDQFTLVMASRADSEACKYLALYGACAVAESFGNAGKHAAIVYDELLAHAHSLVNLGQLTGMAMHEQTRYLHSNLLERACSLSSNKGGGSVTAFALVDTPAENVGYGHEFNSDETHRMSMRTGDTVASIVDRTVRFDTELARNGEWPAIPLTGDGKGSGGVDSGSILIPSLVGQPRPLKALSMALFHMQVAAREAYRSTEEMTKFGLDPYEGGITEARQMKYWSNWKTFSHPPRHEFGRGRCRWAPKFGALARFPVYEPRVVSTPVFDAADRCVAS